MELFVSLIWHRSSVNVNGFTFIAAETILYFEKDDYLLLGAKIIGMLAYDTPFYSINQNYVSEKARSGFDQVNKEVNRFWGAGATAMTAATTSRAIQQSSNNNSGGGRKWGLLAGVVGAAALGAAAYVARDKISSSISDAYDELTFVSDLTDMHGQNERYQSEANYLVTKYSNL